MRKLTALISVLLIFALLFSGCGGKNVPASPDDTELTAPPVTEQTPDVTAPPEILPPPVSPEPEPEQSEVPPEAAPSPEPRIEPEPEKPPVSPEPETEPDPLTPKPVTSEPIKSGAEATIATLYSNLALGMGWGDVWDKYVYSGSKTLGYTRASFITEKEDFQKSCGIVYKGIEILSSEERKPGVFLVNGLLEYEANGEPITENGMDYVIYENGEYYISLSGSLLQAAFTKCTSSFDSISCLDAVVCEYDDKTVIECTLYNLSETDYYLGAAKGLPISVWKDGQSTTVVCAPGYIAKNGYYSITAELPGYVGMPEALRLEQVIELYDIQTNVGRVYQMDIILTYE